MKLCYSNTSPFVRKVMVTAHEKGLVERIELIEETAAGEMNPLVKVPALINDEGTALYDSLVICDYLDNIDGHPTLIPTAPLERSRILCLHALADGIMEAGVTCVMESLRPPEKQWQGTLDSQHSKVTRAIAELERQCASLGNGVDLATISIGVALGYVDFRLSQLNWREHNTAIAGWYGAFAERESMRATVPPTA